MSRRLLGVASFCIGFGMLIAILIPAFGWAFVAGIGLLALGYFMFKDC